MSSEGFKRNLDLAQKASIDVVALNNKVVSMRAIVKRAKLFTINKMSKNIQKLKGKKGTDDQKLQNKNKADRLLEELQILKTLKPDYVSKYALGTTDTLAKLVCKPSTTLEMRALVRLSEQKFIQDVVKEFREKHEDWKNLAAYLLTKHTSREFKKKKKNEEMAKVEANVRATEALVQTYLGEKLGELNNSEDVSDTEEVVTGTESENKTITKKKNKKDVKKKEAVENIKKMSDVSESGDKTLTKKKTKDVKKKEAVENLKKRSDDSDVSSEESSFTDSHSDNEERSSCNDKESESENELDESDENQGDNDDNDSEDEEVHKVKKNTINKTEIETKTNKKSNIKTDVVTKTETKRKQDSKSVIKPSQNANKQRLTRVLKEKIEGDMIIKKLDLNELVTKEETDDVVPNILLEKIAAPEKVKKKVKDSFFDTGDNDNSDEDNGEDETNVDDFPGDEDDDETFDEVEQTFRDTSKADMYRGKKAFSTTFVGSLSSSEMMRCKGSEFRTNDDWKKIRHEMRAKNQCSGSDPERGGYISRGGRSGDFRGRGRGGDLRGRGRDGNFRGGGSGGDFRGRGRDSNFRGGGRGGDFRGRGRDSNFRGGGSFRERSEGSQDRGRQEFGRGRGAPRGPKQFTRGGGSAGNTGSRDSTSGGGEKLHPSWEASRKRQQQQTGIQPFSGKKIKFD